MMGSAMKGKNKFLLDHTSFHTISHHTNTIKNIIRSLRFLYYQHLLHSSGIYTIEEHALRQEALKQYRKRKWLHLRAQKNMKDKGE